MSTDKRVIKGSYILPLYVTNRALEIVVPMLGEPVGAWVKEAECRDMPDLFTSSQGKDWTTAKEFCVECPVRRQCLEYALRTRQIHGTWGGMNQLELRWLLALSALERPKRYPTPVRCPWCHTSSVELTPPPPRSGESEVCKCTSCEFEWDRVYVPRRGRRKAA